MGAVQARTDPTAAGVGTSTFGRLPTYVRQAAAERALDARRFRVPVRWDGERIVSSARGNDNREVEATLQVYYGWPGVRMMLVLAGRDGDWAGYQDGDVAAVVARLRALGITDMSRVDFSGPNEPDLNGAPDMDAVAERCARMAVELRAGGVSQGIWGPVWSHPGGDFARFVNRVRPSLLAGIDWHSYPGGTGRDGRTVEDVLRDAADHHDVVTRVRSMLDDKGLHDVGTDVDELSWTWQQGTSDAMLTGASTVMFALAYCAVLSAGGRVMAYATQAGDLSVISDGTHGRRPSTPMPAYWGIAALTGASAPGLPRLFPHYADTFYRVHDADDRVRTFAVSNEEGGTNVVVINMSPVQMTHTVDGLGRVRLDVLQTDPARPFEPYRRVSTSVPVTGRYRLLAPGRSVTVLSTRTGPARNREPLTQPS